LIHAGRHECPDFDGWAVLSAFGPQSGKNFTDIPVIMITSVDDKNMGFALGAPST